MCGFVGEPATAWRPRDLKLLLQMHYEYGARYAPPGFHSGYNEVSCLTGLESLPRPLSHRIFTQWLCFRMSKQVVLSSATFNAQLPGIVEAFFVPAGAFYNGDPSGVNTMHAHREFLARYHLSESDVPLLKLTPSKWDSPFSYLPRAVVHSVARSKRGGRRVG